MAISAEVNLDSSELKKRIDRFHAVREGILGQVRQVIVGQEEVLDQILTAL
jgi:MoxR-like ATPase